MSESVETTTARAIFQPRAPTGTCCWHSITEFDGSTRWEAVTYDPTVPYITSFPGFSFWVDWCGSAWCNTATLGTTCVDGSIRGISLSSECGGTRGRCLTETMYQKYGDTTPKLHKVFCHHGNWVARTYYIEEPPARKQLESSSSLPASSSATTTLTGPSSTPTASSANTNTSLPPAQTGNSTPPPARDSTGASAGVIAGSVIGGVALISIIAIAFLWFRRKSRRTPVASELPAAPVQQYNGYGQYPHHYTENDKYFQTNAHVSELSAQARTAELPAGYTAVPTRE